MLPSAMVHLPPLGRGCLTKSYTASIAHGSGEVVQVFPPLLVAAPLAPAEAGRVKEEETAMMSPGHRCPRDQVAFSRLTERSVTASFQGAELAERAGGLSVQPTHFQLIPSF